jgi:DNA-binding GntR family transcriptional regulator
VTAKKSLSSILVSEQVPAHLARSVIEEKLRSAILDGRLPEGMAVRQQELATLFGVSRMPVREALRQLEAQSLLKVVMHKGAVVAPLIGEDAVDTYKLRLLLETEALRQSVPNLTPAHIAEARHYIDQLDTETNLSELGRLNRLFHLALYAGTSNRKLLRLIEHELNEEERFLRFHLSAMGLGKPKQDEHIELVDAVEDGDIERAVSLLEHHLNHAANTIQNYLNTRETN